MSPRFISSERARPKTNPIRPSPVLSEVSMFPPRFVRWLFVAAISFLGAESGPAQVTSNQPFLGITYITRKEKNPRHLVMHIALIDLTAPGIGFKLTPPGGTRDAVRQTTLNFL